MKAVVVLLFAVALGTAKPVSEEAKQKMDKINEECSAESGLEAEEVIKAMESEPSDDSKVKEHVFCFQEKLGVINKDGEIQTDALRKTLAAYLEDEAKADKIVEKCTEEKSSPHDTALALAKCIYHEKTTK